MPQCTHYNSAIGAAACSFRRTLAESVVGRVAGADGDRPHEHRIHRRTQQVHERCRHAFTGTMTPMVYLVAVTRGKAAVLAWPGLPTPAATVLLGGNP